MRTTLRGQNQCKDQKEASGYEPLFDWYGKMYERLPVSRRTPYAQCFRMSGSGINSNDDYYAWPKPIRGSEGIWWLRTAYRLVLCVYESMSNCLFHAVRRMYAVCRMSGSDVNSNEDSYAWPKPTQGSEGSWWQ
jgi:hypothetical protein